MSEPITPEQARQEGMQWMREHLVEKLTAKIETSKPSDTQDGWYDAMNYIIEYLNGDDEPLPNYGDDQWCDTCGSELTNPCGCERND